MAKTNFIGKIGPRFSGKLNKANAKTKQQQNRWKSDHQARHVHAKHGDHPGIIWRDAQWKDVQETCPTYMDRDAKGSLLELHREYQKLAKTYNMLTTVDKVKAMIQLMRHGFKGNSKNKKNNAVDSSADNSGEDTSNKFEKAQ